SRDRETDHNSVDPRSPALGSKNLLEARGGNAGAHTAERADRWLVRARRLPDRKGGVREPAEVFCSGKSLRANLGPPAIPRGPVSNGTCHRRQGLLRLP